MKHSIRINGETKEIDCELGSHVYDCNGRKIFEGDKVKVKSCDIFTVNFHYGDFERLMSESCSLKTRGFRVCFGSDSDIFL